MENEFSNIGQFDDGKIAMEVQISESVYRKLAEFLDANREVNLDNAIDWMIAMYLVKWNAVEQIKRQTSIEFQAQILESLYRNS